MIVLPAMPREQTESWLGLLDVYERLRDGWTLIGGQLVHLHCAERNRFPNRPTNDVDAVLDVRANPNILYAFTATLIEVGFKTAGVSADGLQHRWVRGAGSIDVLLPDGVGERAANRLGATGSPTLPTAGGSQALQRSETIAVEVAGRRGFVRRPNLLGALIAKAAAHTNPGDSGRGRHRRDFLVLAGLLTARDLRDETLTRKDRQRLQRIIQAVRNDRALMLSVNEAASSIDRLVVAAGLDL